MTRHLTRRDQLEVKRFVKNKPEWVGDISLDDHGYLQVEAWVEPLGQYVAFENRSGAVLEVSSWALLDEDLRHPNVEDGEFCCVTRDFTTLDETFLALIQLMAYPNFEDPADDDVVESVYYDQFPCGPDVNPIEAHDNALRGSAYAQHPPADIEDPDPGRSISDLLS